MLQKLIFTWQYFQNEQKITIYLEIDLFIFFRYFCPYYENTQIQGIFKKYLHM